MQLHQNIFFPGKLFKYEKTFQKNLCICIISENVSVVYKAAEESRLMHLRGFSKTTYRELY